MLKELEEKFHGIRETGCVVIAYQGMKADEARLVRQEAHRLGSEVMVVRNTLFGLAMDRLGATEIRELIAGATAIVQGPTPVEAARAADAMARTCRAIQVRGAYVDGRLMPPEGVARLAKVPSREVLLSMLAGAFMAPLRRLAAGLMAKPRALRSVLDQLKQRAEQESPSY